MFGTGVPRSSFDVMTFFADAPANGTFLTLTTQMLSICNGENCSVDDLLY